MSFYKRTDQIWQYDKVVNGLRIVFSTGVRERRAAWKIVQTKLADCAASEASTAPKPAMLRNGITAASPTSEHTPLGFVRTEYLGYIRTKQKIDRNYEQHVRYVNILVDQLGEDRDLFSLTEKDLRPLIENLEKSNKRLRNSTINARVLKTIRPLFRYAQLKMEIARFCRINWQDIARPEGDARMRCLTNDEMARLLAVAPDMDGHLYQFAWITGFRVSEIRNLRWSDIHWEFGLITTRIKGGGIHSVPITKKLAGILKTLRFDAQQEFVFTFKCIKSDSRYGNEAGHRYPFSRVYLYERFKESVEKAGIGPYSLHDLRHTAATRFLKATGNIRLLQGLLGHKNIKSTERYAHFDKNDIACGLERIDGDSYPQADRDRMPTSAAPKPEDVSRMDDLLLENMNLRLRIAHLMTENRDRSLQLALRQSEP